MKRRNGPPLKKQCIKKDQRSTRHTHDVISFFYSNRRTTADGGFQNRTNRRGRRSPKRQQRHRLRTSVRAVYQGRHGCSISCENPRTRSWGGDKFLVAPGANGSSNERGLYCDSVRKYSDFYRLCSWLCALPLFVDQTPRLLSVTRVTFTLACIAAGWLTM